MSAKKFSAEKLEKYEKILIEEQFQTQKIITGIDELQKRGIKDKKLHSEIFSRHMEIHLDIAVDIVYNLNSKWGEVERELTSEW